jgi:hypothetical protein
MPEKGYTPEQIIEKLREAEVQLSKGESVGSICRTLGVSAVGTRMERNNAIGS